MKDGKLVIAWDMSDDDRVYLSNPTGSVTNWEKDDKRIDIAPNGSFITKFVKRLKAFRQLEKLFYDI